MDWSWKRLWVFLVPFLHSLNLLEKCWRVYCLSSHTHKSMEWYQFGMIFSSFQTRLIILRKENPLEFSFSCFSNSLNMKNTWVYFLWTCKTLHWKTLMGLDPSFFRFVKYMLRDSMKVSYIEHLLSPSSSLKDKGALTHHGGEKLKRESHCVYVYFWKQSIESSSNLAPVVASFPYSWVIHCLWVIPFLWVFILPPSVT